MKKLGKFYSIFSLIVLLASILASPLETLATVSSSNAEISNQIPTSNSEETASTTSVSSSEHEQIDNNQSTQSNNQIPTSNSEETASITSVSSSEQEQIDNSQSTQSNNQIPTSNSEETVSSTSVSSSEQERAPNEVNAETDLDVLKNNIYLSLDTPTLTSVYTGDSVSSTIQISTSGQVPFTITNPYIEVTFPAVLLPSSSELDTNAFLDKIQIANIIDSRYLKTTTEVKDGKTIYKIYFSELDSSTKLNIPYSFSFSDRITPTNFSITPTVALYTENDEQITSVSDKTYSPKYDERTIVKSVYGTGSSEYSKDGQTLAAGMANINNTNYVSDYGFEYIPFHFELDNTSFSKLRLNKTADITDKLPTYTDINGQTRTALFNATLNPGWVDNGDGTVSYHVEQTAAEIHGDLRHDIREEVNYVTLNLAFPNAPVNENGKIVDYENNVDIQLTPYNASPAEIVKVSDSINFHLDAVPYLGAGMLAKIGNYSIVHDQMGLYSERAKYYVKLANKMSTPLKNIVFTEDSNNFDPRLYVAGLSKIYYRGSKTAEVAFAIKGYRADGSSETIGSTTQLNTNTQTEMNNIATKVQNGELSVEDAGAVEPEFVKYEIIIDPSVELLPGDVLDFNVYMAFKDPYHVPYSEKTDIHNEISTDFNYKISDNTDKSVHLNDGADDRFVPLNESLSLAKYTEPSSTVFNFDDRLRFRLTADLRYLSNARYLDNPTFVDILPKGVSFDSSTTVSGFYNTNPLIDSYSFEKDYMNTGRDAVVIKFKSGIVSDLQGGDDNVPKSLNIFINNAVVNKDIIPFKAETATDNNDNSLYFYFGNEAPDEIESSNKVADTFDLYNGKNIYKATSKVPANVADSISTEKQIRNKGGEWKREIDTDFSEVFDYRLSIKNYFPQDQATLTVYDRLPFADSNGSMFSNTLNSPVKVFSGNDDVTSRFDVYYRNDNAPTNPEDAENSSSWSTTFMTDATAIKLVLKNGETVKAYETLNIQVEAKAPNHDPKLYETSTINTFDTKYDGATVYAKSNSVQNNLPKLPNTTIKIAKVWVGSEKESISYEVYKIGSDMPVANGTLTAADDWKTSLNLPKYDPTTREENHYMVKEVDVPEGYKSSVDEDSPNEFTIKNTQVTSVSGQKIWNDQNDQDGKRPSSIMIHLIADGKTIQDKEVTATDDWKYSFTNLPEYDNGKKVNYTISEDEVSGYTTKVDGYNITNSYTTNPPEKINQNINNETKTILPGTGEQREIYLFVIGLLLIIILGLVVWRLKYNHK